MLSNDLIMMYNGGSDPFHWLKGNGGLGYKPSPHFMHGLGYDYHGIDGSGFSSYKNKFNIEHDFPKNESHSLAEIAKLSGYKKAGIQTIYNKGVGAYYSNHQSVRPQVKSPEQWAMARVYAALNPKSGAYKVDKSHLKRTIRGGMSMENPQFNKNDTRKRYSMEGKTNEEYDYDTDYTGLFDMSNPPIILGDKISYSEDDNNVENTNSEFLEKLDNLEINDSEKAYKVCIDELADLENIKTYIVKYNPSDYLDNPKYKYATQLEEYFTKRAKDIKAEFGKTDDDLEEKVIEDTSKVNKDVKNKYLEVKDTTKDIINTDKHKLHEETGNVYEEVIKLRPKALSSYDGDNSKPLNSKEIKGYSKEFQDFLKDYFRNLPEDEKNKFRDSSGRVSLNTFLSSEDGLLNYFPVDIIKKNTIWELKTHKDFKSKDQEYAISKIRGYYGLGNPIYNIVYSKKNKNNRLDNITFTYTDPKTGKMKTINTLPHNDKGYNYYTNFNTEYGLAYYNALNDEDFKTERNYDPTYLQGNNYVSKMMHHYDEKKLDNKNINKDSEGNDIGNYTLKKFIKEKNLNPNQIEKLLSNNFSKIYKQKYARTSAIDKNKNSSEGYLDKPLNETEDKYLIDKKNFNIIPKRLQEKYMKKITEIQKQKIGKKY